MHMDQNEKLVHYGVTYVMARDGYSGKLVGTAVMPRKNNKLIYEHVYRAATAELILVYGINYEWIMEKSFFYHFTFKRGCALVVGITPFIHMFRLRLHVIK